MPPTHSGAVTVAANAVSGDAAMCELSLEEDEGMKKDDLEPAKVVGNVDLKKIQKTASSSGLPDAEDKELHTSFKTAPQGPIMSGTPGTGASADLMPDKPDTEPTGETPDGLGMEEKPRREGTNATVPAVTDSPVITTLQPTLNEKVAFITGVVIATIANALDQVGMYLIQHEFGGDLKKALKKDPYKGTSLNELAKHKDQPLSRQTLADCVRGAGVGMEMEELGMKRDSIDFYKRVEISRIVNRDARVKLIMMAEAQKLTVKEIRDEVKRQTRKVVSTDRDLSETVMKQLVGRRLPEDKDTREFLLDKDRLKVSLSAGEAAKLLGDSEKLREKSAEDQAFLKQFEKILEEIFVEKRLGEAMPEKAHSDDVS